MARRALDIVKPYTKSNEARLESMAQALRKVDEDRVPGDVVECGVWKGGNIMLARLLSPTRACWMFDTFDGMTEPHPEYDIKRDGERAIDRYNQKKEGGTKWDAVSLLEVQAGFMELGLVTDKIHFVAGPVEHSLKTITPFRIAVLRLDVDWYAPTKAALEALYGRISFNGFLIIDDYGHWMGCKKAVDEYFRGNAPPFHDADYTCRVFRKC